jgi:hypothetical protein
VSWRVAFRFFHFDPTFAPSGKTAVTCFLPTRNFGFWADVQRYDPVRYQTEKRRIEEAVVAILEKMVPDIRNTIEMMDVSTPATAIRYTERQHRRLAVDAWHELQAAAQYASGPATVLDGGPLGYAGRRLPKRHDGTSRGAGAMPSKTVCRLSGSRGAAGMHRGRH